VRRAPIRHRAHVRNEEWRLKAKAVVLIENASVVLNLITTSVWLLDEFQLVVVVYLDGIKKGRACVGVPSVTDWTAVVPRLPGKKSRSS
jgi:hypothetical protein